MLRKENRRKTLITTLEISEQCRRAARRSSGYIEGADLRDVGSNDISLLLVVTNSTKLPCRSIDPILPPKQILGNVISGRKIIKVEFIVLGFKNSKHDVNSRSRLLEAC